MIWLEIFHCSKKDLEAHLFRKLVYRAGVFAGLGVVTTCAGLLLATLLWYLTGFEWVLLAVLLLVFGSFGLVALASSGGNRPPVMSHWEAYAEMSGRQAGGGSFLEMMRPHHIDSNLRLLTNAVLPFCAAVALLFSYGLSY